MKARRELAAELLAVLRRRGLTEAEVFFKQGRSRRFEVGAPGRVGSSSRETGWAIRAGDDRSSLWMAGTGLPLPESDWPAPDGRAIRLPAAEPIAAWRPPADLDASLMAEGEAIGLLEAVERALSTELPGARLLRGVLDEGTSETMIFNSRGVDVEYRSRAAALRVEAVAPGKAAPSSALLVAEREARRFQPGAVGNRLANHLLLARQGRAEMRHRGELLIGSAVATRILAGCLPLLVGAQGERLARRYRDRQGRIGSSALTIVDDGRLPGGVLEAPVDGEGVPTGQTLLVEQGQFRRSLQGWRELAGRHQARPGCVRRHGWRDLPRVAPSHLYIQPATEVAVGSLLGSMSRGCYLVEAEGSGRFDLESDHFRLPVCGFVVQQGQATAPLAGAVLEGSLQSLLQGIQAVARDLAFQPLVGMLGAPTLLVAGFGLRRSK